MFLVEFYCYWADNCDPEKDPEIREFEEERRM